MTEIALLELDEISAEIPQLGDKYSEDTFLRAKVVEISHTAEGTVQCIIFGTDCGQTFNLNENSCLEISKHCLNH
jgi:hypothetical protein